MEEEGDDGSLGTTSRSEKGRRGGPAWFRSSAGFWMGPSAPHGGWYIDTALNSHSLHTIAVHYKC